MDFSTFPWPKVGELTPAWTGRGFRVGESESRVLCFDAASSHWSEDLTEMHENATGNTHPIDRASRQLAIESMGRVAHRPAPVILDVGCSSGFVLDELERNFPGAALIGSDYIAGPLVKLGARMPRLPLLQFDLRQCPLATACVDGVTCLNVLEHIDQDERALGQIFRVLKPGGIAHIEVPAGPELYDIYDEHLMHHRRYRLRGLREMARRTGFEVVSSTHLGFLVYPPFALAKLRGRSRLSAPAELKAKWVLESIRDTGSSRAFAALTAIEMALGKVMSFPVGIRCVAVLRKPEAAAGTL